MMKTCFIWYLTQIKIIKFQSMLNYETDWEMWPPSALRLEGAFVK